MADVVEAVPVSSGALELLRPLRAALDGTGPAVLPVPSGQVLPPFALEGWERGAALVITTSGSTGAPKSVLLSGAALRASADATHARLGGPGRWLLALPATHIAGVQVLVRSLVAGTSPAVLDLAPGFRAAAFTEAAQPLLATPGPHYTALVPTQLARLLADDVSALREFDAVLLGGAATPLPLLEAARAAGVRVVTTYGMSETAGGCVYDGVPLDGVQVRLAPDQPTSTQHPSAQPASAQPASNQPTSGQPTSARPASSQLTSDQPTPGQHASGQPTSGQLFSDQLAFDHTQPTEHTLAPEHHDEPPDAIHIQHASNQLTSNLNEPAEPTRALGYEKAPPNTTHARLTSDQPASDQPASGQTGPTKPTPEPAPAPKHQDAPPNAIHAQPAFDQPGPDRTEPAEPTRAPGHRDAVLDEVRGRLVSGRIELAGPVLALGYRGVPFSDGWFRTGDLGRFRSDGTLEVLGRADDMIVTGGEKVPPALVERALAAVPGVREVCVVGVPDAEWGQVVVAAVVAFGPSVSSLQDAVREAVGRAAVPKRVLFVSALPTRGPGKVDRAAVARSFG